MLIYNVFTVQVVYLILTKLQLIFQNGFGMLTKMGRAPDSVILARICPLANGAHAIILHHHIQRRRIGEDVLQVIELPGRDLGFMEFFQKFIPVHITQSIC